MSGSRHVLQKRSNVCFLKSRKHNTTTQWCIQKICEERNNFVDHLSHHVGIGSASELSDGQFKIVSRTSVSETGWNTVNDWPRQRLSWSEGSASMTATGIIYILPEMTDCTWSRQTRQANRVLEDLVQQRIRTCKRDHWKVWTALC